MATTTEQEPAVKKRKSENIYKARNSYRDRAKVDREEFPGLTLTIETIETILLLLDSQEDNVLISVLNAITKFMRKQEENVFLIRDKGMLELLMAREFYMNRINTLVRRFALYIGEMIVEVINPLKDLQIDKTQRLMEIALDYTINEDDDFCLEYLSIIVNKCCDDPHVARSVLSNNEFLGKFFDIISSTENPDCLLHGFEALAKLLQVQSFEEMQSFSTDERFPIDRILCELTNEFAEIRIAALRLAKILVPSCEVETCVFSFEKRDVFLLQQLVKLLCDEVKTEMIPPEDLGMGDGEGLDSFTKQKLEMLTDVIGVLATALRNEKMTSLFFEHGLFEKVIGYMNSKDNNILGEGPRSSKPKAIDETYSRLRCQILMIFSEIAKFEKFLNRLQATHVTQRLLECLLSEGAIGASWPPATHILTGLNRLMKCSEAAQEISDAMENGLISKLLAIIGNVSVPIKTREQTAELVKNLLVFTFHPTARELLDHSFNDLLAELFDPDGLNTLSVDLILNLLAAIEHLDQHEDYRQSLTQTPSLVKNLALLLKNTFDVSIVTRSILRCLVTMVDEECARNDLLENYICNSINRALKSRSDLLKTDATNFIMQTTRFPEFSKAYIDCGVLETLIMNQKFAYCVSTWIPAIDSILSKHPTYKFCIRNHLGFTDITVGQDFEVSKQKFDDFRVFMDLLKEDVSPMHPVIVVNFEREKTPSELIVQVPSNCFLPQERGPGFKRWCYCRKPGDDVLPRYLDELNCQLERQGLCVDAAAARRCIDFENIAKRVKLIAQIVDQAMGDNLKVLDINSDEECSEHDVRCHFRELCNDLHCNFIPLGMVRTGCQFERAILFKCLADQIGLPCTLQRSVNGRILYNEVPLPVEMPRDVHCDEKTMQFMPWRLLRPTHVVDLLFNVGDLYPMQSRQALQYLRLV